MIRRGDILTLGDHRLMCGDSRDPEQVARLLGDARPGILFTSPPYLAQRVYAAALGEWLPMITEATLAPVLSEDAQIFVNLGPVHQNGEWQPYWTPWLERVRAHGWRSYQLLVWDKLQGPSGKFGGRLSPSYEFVFHLNKREVAVNRTAVSKHAGQKFKPKRANTPTAGYVRAQADRGPPVQPTKLARNVVSAYPHLGGARGNFGHPAVMGIGLPLQVLNAYSRPYGAVYEPFCGSGTTLVAAARLGLRGFGMELSPEYCDIAADRLAKELA